MNKNNTDKQRQCRVCKEIKPLDDTYFYKEKGRPYGYEYRCRKCNNIQSRNRHKSGNNSYKSKRNTSKRIVREYTRIDSKKSRCSNLTVEFVNESLSQHCVYCDYPSTGLDRVDNKKGHTIENCVPCCKECNVARMDNFTHEEMKIIGKTIKLIKQRRSQG